MTACVLFTMLLCLFTSCNTADKKLAYQSQRLLDKADQLIEHREFDEAYAQTQKAHSQLETLLNKDKTNADYILLLARSNFVAFIAKNTRIIENSPLNSLSLTRLPEVSQYKDYPLFISQGIDSLLELEKNPTLLSFQQKASLHSLLAAMYHLNSKTLDKSISEYERAIQVNREWISDLQSKHSKRQPKGIAINRIRNQIQALKMNQITVYIIQHNWSGGLNKLETLKGKDDLKYFDINLQHQYAHLDDLKNQASQDKKNSSFSKVKNFFRKSSTPQKEDINSYGSLSLHKVEVLQAKINIAYLKNQLIYRMICYAHLGKTDQLKTCSLILKKYDASLNTELLQLLR